LESFAPTHQSCWENLVCEIEDWLISSAVRSNPHYWHWGLKLFWIAFVAAHPSFPFGTWPAWNSLVPLAGLFMDACMEIIKRADFQTCNKTFCLVHRDLEKDCIELWQEFWQHISLFVVAQSLRF